MSFEAASFPTTGAIHLRLSAKARMAKIPAGSQIHLNSDRRTLINLILMKPLLFLAASVGLLSAQVTISAAA
jgi:hypothetical protein